NKPRVHVGLGIATIFMVFTILCFTILATLSYMSAQNQNNSSLKYEKNMQEYYQSDLKANQQLKEIKQNMHILEAFCREKSYDYNKGTNEVTYQVKMNQTMDLRVKVLVKDQELVIKEWKSVHNEKEETHGKDN
ncbi:MAG: hypothetical protein RSA96_08730, partial [Erysipelotrichaceae bacterium]